MRSETIRKWTVWYVYAAIAAHLAVGMLLPLIAGLSMFDGYHQAIESAFWGPAIPAQARAQQVWWISLFGPTVQAAAIWMAGLAWMGNRQRNAFAWGALIAGMVLWAPQDMLISLQAQCWAHVWIDTFALVTMLPPLIYLFLVDRKKVAV
ncbi:MAG TPA: cell division protein [Telluria sp.]|jgi:hypothetical protein